MLSREAQLVAAVAALQRGLSAARREADGSVSTTKYMQARIGERCRHDVVASATGTNIQFLANTVHEVFSRFTRHPEQVSRCDLLYFNTGVNCAPDHVGFSAHPLC